MSEAINTRLAEIKSLGYGNHENIHEGSCIMEAASYVAGEPWSDHPKCVCLVISTFLRTWNDSLSDEERNSLLLPLLPLLINTRATTEVELRRVYMALDWLIREQTPAWINLAGLTKQANILASLPEITGKAKFLTLKNFMLR